MAGQTAGAVRRVSFAPGLSPEARTYLAALLDALAGVSGETTKRRHAAPAGPIPSADRPLDLRRAVHDVLRDRADQLVRRVRQETGVDADDYYRIVTAEFALDEVERVAAIRATSRTTQALHDLGRLDLSIEQAIADWAQDLPLTADLVEGARGRLAYWGSQ